MSKSSKYQIIWLWPVIIFLTIILAYGSPSNVLTDTTVVAHAKSLSVKQIKKELIVTAPNIIQDKKIENKAYIVVNDNKPYFKKNWLTKKSFEYYSPLDKLGRCGTTFACVGKDIMPTEERGDIGSVKPSGWHTVKYDKCIISDLYLYNRCHLLGYQLTGENANKKNLITGTRYLNIEGMLPFEEKVASVVKDNEVHVLYRVTPIYTANNLVADGVLMEAMSCEDKGKTLSYCVFCPNIQPGIIIDYKTGESKIDPYYKADERISDSLDTVNYILNTNTHKFHYPFCDSVKDMATHNKKESNLTRDELIIQGYSACGRCKP